MSQDSQSKKTMPAQHQDVQPGHENLMNPQPEFDALQYKGSEKLLDKVAIITGGDSGIGRAVAVHYAKEGADVVISYLDEHEDANETKRLVEQEGRRCILMPGDIGEESFCGQIISETINQLGKIDILVNNAAEQHPQAGIEEISKEQLERTFKTNIFSFFYMVKAALPHLKQGSSIINTSSITAYAGNEQLIDYSSTKGAITTFTRSLSMSLVKKGIRVNGVAPGPIWTPLIPSTFDANKVSEFGADTPMGRPGQPDELAPSYVFLASNDSTYITGQMIHVNGGKIING
ncbi:SDR family oxidoreductase [Bacillus sp. V2I10]|uniref:SDR family oxidoreductase n=1 Tax=Bacillus sp. V2I10 TaxID=3042276 RepID=UPI002782E1E4|nr:SDR family oxidoreductase [Bacillus sp. V2I10]MDQ0861252.1 NAD(P)-dependent dehydrogenase (short-subunit alcohol dehydrogenase family) [Bacillus sp. V2I10]